MIEDLHQYVYSYIMMVQYIERVSIITNSIMEVKFIAVSKGAKIAF